MGSALDYRSHQSFTHIDTKRWCKLRADGRRAGRTWCEDWQADNSECPGAGQVREWHNRIRESRCFHRAPCVKFNSTHVSEVQVRNSDGCTSQGASVALPSIVSCW